MGIYDRQWYGDGARSGRGTVPGFTSAVKVLVIANAAIFFVQTLLRKGTGWEPVHGGLGLTPYDVVEKFMLWQLVTSMFLHANLTHLLFNMLFLWMFGTHVERRLGAKSFLRFYFAAGIFSAIVYVIIGLFGAPFTPAVGASGAIMGVVVYFTLLNPNAIVLFMLFIPMKMKWATAIIVGFDLFYFVFGGGGNVAHTAHLGGALFGFLYHKYAHRVDRYFTDLDISARVRREGREGRRYDELQEDVDRLLVKISQGGLDSLSDKEKRFLKEASEALRKRRP